MQCPSCGENFSGGICPSCFTSVEATICLTQAKKDILNIAEDIRREREIKEVNKMHYEYQTCKPCPQPLHYCSYDRNSSVKKYPALSDTPHRIKMRSIHVNALVTDNAYFLAIVMFKAWNEDAFMEYIGWGE